MAARFKRACHILFFIISIAGLAACASLPGLRQATVEAPFVPPTIAASPPPTPTLSLAASPLPTTTPACPDNQTYLTVLTVPDGTEVAAGSTIDKRWPVQNSGTCNWDERYHFKLLNGPAMGAPEDEALFPARAGSKKGAACCS
jgi:hypothetical protein